MARILCVDDEPDVLAFLRVVLGHAGHQVKTADNAEAAFASVLAEPPDLVITDVMMSGESGYSLCRKIRANPPTRTTPVLVATILEGEAEATESGATAFLSKPLEEADLLRAVGAVLPESDGQDLLAEGLERLRQGDLAAAAASFEWLLAGQPKNALASWARYYLGGIQQRRDQIDEALRTFGAILEDDPGFWRAHSSIGTLLHDSGAAEMARGHFERSLELYPDQPDIRKRLDDLGTLPDAGA